MGYKVLGLKVANLRNIDLVEVDFKGKNFIEITGNNGSGKSTMLDALFTAILGTKHFGRGFDGWRVIQSGEQKALIKATIGNRERQIEIKRSITRQDKEDGTDTGGSLTVIDSNGEKLGQEFLDRLLSEFTIDPLAFSRESPKAQAETLKRLAGIDTDTFDALRKKAAEERLIAGRQATVYKAKVAVPIEPAEAISLQELFAQKEVIQKKNNERMLMVNEKQAVETKKAFYENRLGDVEKEILHLEEKISDIRIEKEKIKNTIKTYVDMAAVEIPLEESTEAVDAMISDAERINAKAAAYAQYLKDLEVYETASALEKKMDSDVKRIEDEKRAAITNSKLPFKNIVFDDDVGILIDGVPFSQKSAAEQLRMSTRIGMEMDPDLRVICIRDGSLLDEESYAIVKELSERHDYQILVESVGEKQGDDQIVLRAGHVISEFEHAETTGSKVRKMDDTL